MNIKDSVVFITGANRGLGLGFARVALALGAKKVYAGARDTSKVTLAGVTSVKIDVNDPQQVAAAAALGSDATIVINNAGIASLGGTVGGDSTALLREQIETNVFGVLNVTQAFAPILAKNGGGAVLNVNSALSFVNMPMLGAYSVSKGATWVLTNGIRNDLRAQGTLVVGLHAGFIDTDLVRGFPGAKADPDDVARQGLQAIEAGEEEVLVDDTSRQLKGGLAGSLYLKNIFGG